MTPPEHGRVLLGPGPVARPADRRLEPLLGLDDGRGAGRLPGDDDVEDGHETPQCASAHERPCPTSTSSGTSSDAAWPISRCRSAPTAATSASGVSTTSSSWT